MNPPSATGRDDKIRTCDFFVPNEALYQAELRPDIATPPTEIIGSLSTMTVCTAHLAFVNLGLDPPPAKPYPDHHAYISLFCSEHVIELENADIRFAAIHARVII